MDTGQFPVELTADGSATFFSKDFGEWFHSRSGAYEEARNTYVQATNLLARAQSQSSLTILDVCYGLGYNTAAALEALWAIQSEIAIRLVALELDDAVPRAAIAQGLLKNWPIPVKVALTNLATSRRLRGQLSADLLIGDARQHVVSLVQSGLQADVIFLDPFSPPRCPQLWTVEFLHSVAQCLHSEGILVTYSAAAAVRTALKLAGLQIGSLAVPGRRWPSTLASPIGDILPALSQQEIEHLATRAAVPYRDPTLQDSPLTIQQRRRQEQQASSLSPTGAWRRRWLSP
ncbi:MAG: MnmC family methyltransferase [Cyanobacteria bacterium P01_C01_bin.120]